LFSKAKLSFSLSRSPLHENFVCRYGLRTLTCGCFPHICVDGPCPSCSLCSWMLLLICWGRRRLFALPLTDARLTSWLGARTACVHTTHLFHGLSCSIFVHELYLLRGILSSLPNAPYEAQLSLSPAPCCPLSSFLPNVVGIGWEVQMDIFIPPGHSGLGLVPRFVFVSNVRLTGALFLFFDAPSFDDAFML